MEEGKDVQISGKNPRTPFTDQKEILQNNNIRIGDMYDDSDALYSLGIWDDTTTRSTRYTTEENFAPLGDGRPQGERILGALGIQQDITAVDFGSSDGAALDGLRKYLIEKGKKVKAIAVEVLPSIIHYGKKYHPSLEFIQSKIQDVDLPDNSANLAICHQVIPNLPLDHVILMLENILRIMKQDGIFFGDLESSFQTNDLKHLKHTYGRMMPMNGYRDKNRNYIPRDLYFGIIMTKDQLKSYVEGLKSPPREDGVLVLAPRGLPTERELYASEMAKLEQKYPKD
ncbi:methyltransferase domain-containing protein [Candidatus Roizmanbacteria bacterium]|nr:methyltransferase domain-containing protein [Candidatus Roizmanbacteria bacterium]